MDHRHAECLLIVAATLATYGVAGRLPAELAAGRLVLLLSALLLFQGLLRDLYLLDRARRRPPGGPPRAMRCLCLESGVGLLGLLAGAVLVLASPLPPLTLGPGAWTAAVGATLATGFAIRNWVLTLDPPGLRHDPDHLNIVVLFRSRP